MMIRSRHTADWIKSHHRLLVVAGVIRSMSLRAMRIAATRYRGRFHEGADGAWTNFRPGWQERFELDFLPGLEGSRFVLAVHKELGWAKAPWNASSRGEPIRLRPWSPEDSRNDREWAS